MAQRDIVASSKEGDERTIAIRIGQPYRRDTGEWVCPVAVEGLLSVRLIFGEDSFQALMLAQSVIKSVLSDFVDKGGRLLDSPGGIEIDIERLLSTGVVS